jgi:hypothetical protein
MVVKPNPAPEKREIRVRGPADAKSVKVAICLTQVAPNILRARPLVKPHILCLPE